MKNNIVKTFKSKLIFGKYSLKNLIAKGTIGEVFLGKNILDNKEYAIKLEKAKKGESILKQEAYILLLLKGPGFPSVISFGQSGKYHVLVENLLGESIYNIWLKKKKKLNLKDTCMFAIQALERLEYIHSKNYLHRDIKPGNFLVGNPDKSQIYLIDFGNARKYRSSRTGKHIPFAKNRKMCGTIIFLSSNVLKGIEQTRKDELESLGLVIIYLYQGFLPWSDLKCKDIHQYLDKIKKLKLKINNEELCKYLPKEICEYMNYVQNMNFDENPDYRYLQSLFSNILGKTGEKNDLMFSWVDKKTIPRKIISRSNNKSLQKIYHNIFSFNSSKLISISNSDIPFSNSLDNQFWSKYVIKSNNMDLSKDKNTNNISNDNTPNISCNNNNDNKKRINFKQKIIHINLEDVDKKTNISSTLNNDNCHKKNINYLVNQRPTQVKINERKNNLNSKKIILIKNNDKMKNALDINYILNKNIISKDKIFTRLNNKKQINNPNKKRINLNLVNNNINNNNNNKIKNYININNININRLSDHNYTYLTIYNNLKSPKLNIKPNNYINQTSRHSNRENQMKYIYTKENNKSNKSPNNFHKPILYKSIFGYQSDSNKEISDISGKLIRKYQTYSQQKYLINKRNHLNEKNDIKRCILKPRRLDAELFLYSKINSYNSPLNNKNGIKFNKSPELKTSLRINSK